MERRREGSELAVANRSGWRRRGGTGIAVVAAAVSLTACGAEGVSIAPEAGEPSAESIAGNLPLDFPIHAYQGAQVLGGSRVQFSEVVARGRPVVLNMWAGLCPPCRSDMPHFQAVYDDFKDEIVLFGLDVGAFMGLGDRLDAQALVEEIGVTFPVGSTDRRDVLREYRVVGVPSTYFILPDGTVLGSWTGPLDAGTLREKVEALVAASQAEVAR